MKQLITATASLILIMALIIETVKIHSFYISIMRADYEFASFNDMVRLDGYVNKECDNYIKDVLSEIFGCECNVIFVTGPEHKVEKGKMINYSVSVLVECSNGSWILSSKKAYEYLYYREFSVVSMAD